MSPPPDDLTGWVAHLAGVFGQEARRYLRGLGVFTIRSQDVEDMIQDALTLILKNYERHRPLYREAWARRILHHTIVDHLRRKQREGGRLDSEHLDQRESCGPDPDQAFTEQERRRQVDEAVAGLPEPYPTIYDLIRQGFSNAEAAARLGVSLNTYTKQVCRLVQHVVRALGRQSKRPAPATCSTREVPC